MICELCHKLGHNAFDCNSPRTYIIYEAVNHWIGHRLRHIYMTAEPLTPIYWLSESDHFRRLSKGDLMYLMHENRADMEEFILNCDKKFCLYMYLGYKTLAYSQRFEYPLQDRIHIDAEFWFNMTYMDIEEANQVRAESQQQFSVIEHPIIIELMLNEDGPFNCAVCLEEEVAKEKICQLGCKHYFCWTCIQPVLSKKDRPCPLCREPILKVQRSHPI